MEEKTKPQLIEEFKKRHPNCHFNFANIKKAELIELLNQPENPLAFPMYNELGDIHEPGMTLRDYFSAKYMQANADNEDFTAAGLAMESYKMADAMLKARTNKRG